MGTRVECFMVVPLELAEEELRRYASGSDCPGRWGYHNAMVVIGHVPYPLERDVDGDAIDQERIGQDDPRWPVKCDCGYVFQPDDKWQINRERLFTRPDGGEPFTWRHAPAGAMRFITYYERKVPEWCGPDGHALMVKLPDGADWHVDGPSKNSKQPWQRTGTAPRFTARPSILTSGYHGFLTDGVLESC
jgi:hypothetical protein